MIHGLTCTVFRAEIYQGDLWGFLDGFLLWAWYWIVCSYGFGSSRPPPGSGDSLTESWVDFNASFGSHLAAPSWSVPVCSGVAWAQERRAVSGLTTCPRTVCCCGLQVREMEVGILGAAAVNAVDEDAVAVRSAPELAAKRGQRKPQSRAVWGCVTVWEWQLS